MTIIRPCLHSVGLSLGVKTSILGAMLDQEQDHFPSGSLYAESWTMILVNLLLIGPLTMSAISHFIQYRSQAFWKRAFQAFGLIGIHSLFYGCIHRCMHKVRSLRPIHKFHHKFNHNKDEPVMPSSANAVSMEEFAFAYMLPFVIGAFVFRPHIDSLVAAVSTVSIFNLLVHSPHLKDHDWIPGLVPPFMHLDHHKKKTPFYFAPTLHFPWK